METDEHNFRSHFREAADLPAQPRLKDFFLCQFGMDPLHAFFQRGECGSRDLLLFVAGCEGSSGSRGEIELGIRREPASIVNCCKWHREGRSQSCRTARREITSVLTELEQPS